MEGIINPTNAEMDLKEGVGENARPAGLFFLDVWKAHGPLQLSLLPVVCSSAGSALEKAGGRDFMEAVKELRKAQGPLEVASGMEIWKLE